MLTLTDNAATVIARYVKRVHRRGAAGVRIRRDVGRASGMRVEVVSAPLPDDQVVEKNGARVFLDHSVATYLSTKELDAVVDSHVVNLTVRDRGGVH